MGMVILVLRRMAHILVELLVTWDQTDLHIFRVQVVIIHLEGVEVHLLVQMRLVVIVQVVVVAQVIQENWLLEIPIGGAVCRKNTFKITNIIFNFTLYAIFLFHFFLKSRQSVDESCFDISHYVW